MNQAWPKKRLADVCHILGGATPATKNPKFYGGDIPWATVGDMNVEVITATADYITKAAVADCSTNVIPSGSIVMATRVGLGKVCALGQDTAINQDLKGLTPKNAKELSNRWLYWWLKSKAADIQKAGTGATVQGVKMTFVQELEIPLAPLAEQKRIVALLDEAFAGIDEAISMIESQSASIKQLLESYLGGVFSTEQHGWETRKLEECTTIIMGQSPEGSTYNAKAIGTPLINGPVEFSADAFGETVEEKWTTEPTKLCKKGDLILCVRGSTTGRMNIAGFDACIGRGVAAIRAKQSQSWVNHFVNASRSKILGMGKGATFPNVSANDIGQMELTIPPEDMQELLSKKFDDLRLLNADMCRSMEKRASLLKTLKSSFLAQAFAGELTA